jgi:hypothetical protein
MSKPLPSNVILFNQEVDVFKEYSERAALDKAVNQLLQGKQIHYSNSREMCTVIEGIKNNFENNISK